MFPLIETIKCKDGILFNMEFHQARFEDAQKHYFGINPKIHLSQEIVIPETARIGLYRCRITYAETIDKIEFLPHSYREIKSLKLIEDSNIEYRFKYADRKNLQKLFDLRGDCDDIIIVQNGYLTDSFAANLVFFDGYMWITPDSPLLPGTQRAKLIHEGKIVEQTIKIDDLSKYSKVGLINALNNLEEMPVIETEKIYT